MSLNRTKIAFLSLLTIACIGCAPAPPYVGTYKVIMTPAVENLAKRLDSLERHAGNMKAQKQIDFMKDAILTISGNGAITLEHPSYDIEGFTGTYTIAGDVMTVTALSTDPSKPPQTSTFLFDKKNLTLTQTSLGTDIVYKKR